MFEQVRDLLTFKAFTPSVLDIKVPIKERLKGSSALGVLLSSRCITCSKIEITPKQTNVVHHKTFILNSEGDRISTIASFAREHELEKAVVLCSPGFEAIRMDQRLSLRGVDRLYALKHSTSEFFGEPLEEGRAYAYVANPEADESVCFSYCQAKTNAILNMINKAKLAVVRISCAIYSMVEYLVHETDFLEKDQWFLMYASNAALIASIQNGQFKHIGFKTKVYFKDLEEIVPQMITRFGCEHNALAYVNCSDWDLHAFFEKKYPKIKPVSAFEDCKRGVFLAACHG